MKLILDKIFRYASRSIITLHIILPLHTVHYVSDFAPYAPIVSAVTDQKPN